MPRMAGRMLVLAVLVFASGLALRVAWEPLNDPREAQAQSPVEYLIQRSDPCYR
jgi:hypothetical protein